MGIEYNEKINHVDAALADGLPMGESADE